MLIHFLDFQCDGFADIETDEIFVSYNCVDIKDCIRHEQAHLISKSIDHDDEWFEAYSNIGNIAHPHKIHLASNISNVTIMEEEVKAFCKENMIACNIGNVTGIQNLLTDYHLLQAYRKFSQHVLGTTGRWDVVGEFGRTATGELRPGHRLRLYPTPKGSFPVVVQYMPTVTEFRSPMAREILYRAMVAETKIMVGAARKKYSGIPAPDGSTVSFDGEQLFTQGQEEKLKAAEDANLLNEPLGPLMF